MGEHYERSFNFFRSIVTEGSGKCFEIVLSSFDIFSPV